MKKNKKQLVPFLPFGGIWKVDIRMDVIRFEKIKDKIIGLRGEKVILDSDVAELYGVETREVNQAVSNNPDKFPEEFLFELSKDEKLEVVKNFDHLNRLKYSPYLPKAFTMKKKQNKNKGISN